MKMTTRTRRQVSFLCLGGLALAAAGCKRAPETETLLIAGSSTMSAYLAPVVKEFAAKNPSVNVVSEGGGSTAGLVALKHGAIDVAAVARPIKPTEDDLYLRDYLVARDGVAVVVNPANPVGDLTVHQLARIFDGEATKWHDVGGGEGAILVVARDQSSHVRKSFEELLVLSGDESAPGQRIAANAAELLDIVRATPGAIGYLTLHRMGPGVKALRVNGVEMTRMTMLSGRYPLSRSFYLAVHLNGAPLADKFIEFTLSKDGQNILATDGLLETY
jgi:phosphate transport system substrate-binding protein